MPTERMGPAARSFAADAHDCIMVRIQTDLPHTSVWREDAPNGELPSDDHADINRRHQTLKLRKGPSRGSSSLRVLRPQGTQTHATQGPNTQNPPLAFRSLDPFRALREPDRRRRDEERPSRSEQRTDSKPKNNRLTGKAPYKF